MNYMLKYSYAKAMGENTKKPPKIVQNLLNRQYASLLFNEKNLKNKSFMFK
jgi:hypothetical protein